MPPKGFRLLSAMAVAAIGAAAATQGASTPSSVPAPTQQSSVERQAPTKQQSMVPATSTAGLSASVARVAKRYAAEGKDFQYKPNWAWVGRKIRGRFDFYCVPV